MQTCQSQKIITPIKFVEAHTGQQALQARQTVDIGGLGGMALLPHGGVFPHVLSTTGPAKSESLVFKGYTRVT